MTAEDLYATPEVVERQIADGRNDAMLIEWTPTADLFADGITDPMASIEASKLDFIQHGWRWNPERKQLEKDGWYAWYRSQGTSARPIIQWGRIR